MYAMSNLKSIWHQKVSKHFILASKSLKNHLHFLLFCFHVKPRVAGTIFIVYFYKFGIFSNKLALFEFDSF